MSKLGRLRDPGLPVALAVLAGITYLFRLNAWDLADFDEAIYAEVSREILHSGDWVILHFNQAPWFDKPPLYMWLEASLFHFFGADETIARLPSALAGVGVVLLTFAIGRRLYGPAVATAAALVLLLCAQMTYAARFGTTDVLLTLFLYLQVWSSLRAATNTRWWYAAGVFAGLGILTKGAAGLAGPIVVAVTLAVDGRSRELLSTPPWLGLGLGALIALPWHLLALLQGGHEFFDTYLGYHVLRRTAEPLEGHPGTLAYYPAQARQWFFPWFYAAGLGFLLHFRERVSSRAPAVLVIVLFGLYTLVQTKLPWYIVPTYPALALFAAWLGSRALAGDLLALGGVGLAGLLALSKPNFLAPYPLAWWLTYVALALIAGIALLLARRRPAYAIVPLTAAFFAAVSAFYIAPDYKPQRTDVVAVARAAGGSSGTLIVYDSGSSAINHTPVWPRVVFYSRRHVLTVHDAGAVTPPDAIVAREDEPKLGSRLTVQERAAAGDLAYVKLYSR